MCQYLLEVKSGLTKHVVICQLDSVMNLEAELSTENSVLSITWSSVRELREDSGRAVLVLVHLLHPCLFWAWQLCSAFTSVYFPPQFVIPGIHEEECRQRVLKFWQFWKFFNFPLLIFSLVFLNTFNCLLQDIYVTTVKMKKKIIALNHFLLLENRSGKIDMYK